MSIGPTSSHRNLVYGLGITAEITLIVGLFYIALVHIALGGLILAVGVTTSPADLPLALTIYVAFAAPTLPLFKTLWHWSQRWFFGQAVIQRSFTRTNLCAKLAVLMRNLLAISATATAILAAGLNEPEIRWVLTALGITAIWLLWAVAEREHKAEINNVGDTAIDRFIERAAAVRRARLKDRDRRRSQILEIPGDDH